MIPIEGYPNLFRDKDTGAIVNCDTQEYQNYVSIKKNRISQKEDIENLKREISDIKNLLMEILNETRENKS